MSYLADTTLLIDYYRGNIKAKTYFQKLKSGKINFSISVVTEAEIWCGIKNNKELLSWLATLDLMGKVDVNSEIARKAGEIYKDYGHYMGKTSQEDLRHMVDAFIAATCVVLNKILITSNYKHFKQLESRGLIACESYTK
jgi:predicted nucleic acid-binding protein